MVNKHIHNPLRKNHSIFIKLLLVLLGTAALVHLLVGTFFSIVTRPASRAGIEKDVRNMAEYLVHEMGNPPDTLKAREIEKLLDIQIRYESPQMIWATSSDMPRIEEVRKLQQKARIGHLHPSRHYYIISPSEGGEFLFKGNFGGQARPIRHLLITLFLILTLVFMGSYYFLVRIFRPIRLLIAGTTEVAHGNLDVQIPVQSSDELRHLTQAFNNMTQRIREMIRARDRLLLDVSHELRSPITRMKVALEFIPKSKNKAAILEDLAELETMVTEILETERLKNGHGKLDLKKTDIVPLLKTVIRQYQDAPPGIRTAGLPKQLLVRIDAKRIKIVLKNILENAVKYSTPKSGPVVVTMQQDVPFIKITVQDDGPGIPEKELPYIFEPFYRVDRSRSKESGGYGLGLNMCKTIMEAHRGKIQLRNHPDGGVVVELILPRS